MIENLRLNEKHKLREELGLCRHKPCSRQNYCCIDIVCTWSVFMIRWNLLDLLSVFIVPFWVYRRSMRQRPRVYFHLICLSLLFNVQCLGLTTWSHMLSFDLYSPTAVFNVMGVSSVLAKLDMTSSRFPDISDSDLDFSSGPRLLTMRWFHVKRPLIVVMCDKLTALWKSRLDQYK